MFDNIIAGLLKPDREEKRAYHSFKCIYCRDSHHIPVLNEWLKNGAIPQGAVIVRPENRQAQAQEDVRYVKCDCLMSETRIMSFNVAFGRAITAHPYGHAIRDRHKNPGKFWTLQEIIQNSGMERMEVLDLMQEGLIRIPLANAEVLMPEVPEQWADLF